ncbi:DNA binding domain protein, excisionase family [Capnocytophaga ochracea DSM 7271]|uniref:DNA binding domain protein, excisionase family n=1 Tax=Capnocytophaga ochracea (strain ATCC 27872 / DSM 7271 / CCUG 9716 / JCM 12966 / NCTC 12371 / SS31 / VPI 2845) TaxID=521097 RepID=C7M961_CAPOD|nr:helix-turn-helix domain-containing protein [Capnocytophaga ochracea]ACU92407.1 DNA binding domain protein, excisionase family [Capnocytophaga ochracea DSM 7271]UAK51148.1 helix-turn-helix domain-containing protein [Capnocytophaga ochracea]
MDIQFIQITPVELKELIQETIKCAFREFAKDFQPKEPTEYLTRKEVVKMLNINMSTLHHWTKQGKLKAYSIGARIYYKRHEVDEALETFK